MVNLLGLVSRTSGLSAGITSTVGVVDMSPTTAVAFPAASAVHSGSRGISSTRVCASGCRVRTDWLMSSALVVCTSQLCSKCVGFVTVSIALS